MRDIRHLFIPALTAALIVAAAGRAIADEEEESMADPTITSDSFSEGERIPQTHAYKPEGDNVSPGLSWSGVPSGTKELALIVDDPDAPTEKPWVHWLVYKIPAGTTEIPQNASAGTGQLSKPADALEGKNDFDDLGWGGPLPPEGHGTHHYHFKLYALDTELDVGAGAAKPDLLQAMEGHTLAEAELIGTYSR